MQHCQIFLSRRELPWKVDGEATGVSSKLKLLEQELLNLERVGKSDPSKVPSLMRKQAKRYQALSGKIDDLCRRMVIHLYFGLIVLNNLHFFFMLWQSHINFLENVAKGKFIKKVCKPDT